MGCSLAPGSRGIAVLVLQEALYSCYYQEIELDGRFGDETREALREAQRQINRAAMEHILDEDGLYGPQTRSRLEFALFNPNGGVLNLNVC